MLNVYVKSYKCMTLRPLIKYIFLLIFSGSIFGQAVEPSIPPDDEQIILDPETQQRIESIIEDLEEDIDITELFNELESLRQQPLNINTASANELARIIFLNPIQINNLIEHRKKLGNLLSLLELQSVDGFDLETINAIEPFITISEVVARRQFSLADILTHGNSQFFLRYQRLFEEQTGFSDIEPELLAANPNARYLGSPFRLFTRYRFTYYNNLSFGITAEKDPGEELFAGSQPDGFDFYSAHFHLRNAGRIKALSIGDFQVQFGQGLALWSGLAFGKSSQAVNIMKNGIGLRQYTSADENNFMRGAGVTVSLGSFEVTGFLSSKNRDANVLEIDTITQEDIVITSLLQSGLHRTPRELADKNSVRETYWGSNITFRRSNYHIGITGYMMELGSELRRNLSFHNQFELNSSTNWAASVDYNYIIRNFNVFGEIATSQSGGHAILNGIMMALDPGLSLSLLHRSFSRDYQSLLSNAFSESARASNENGLYVGLNARINPRWSINAYADHFTFPWMRHRTYALSRGYDYLVQVNFRPQRRTEIYARYRIRNRPLNHPGINAIPYPVDFLRQNIRIHFSYQVSPSFTFNNRIEIVDIGHYSDNQRGFLIYHDIAYKNFASRWTFNMRYAVFDTDGFDSRIYAHENDVLYAFSFPFYSDKGHRAYIVARYRINRNLDLQARLAQTFFSNRNTIGSGLDLIHDNSRTELKAQLRARF